MTVKHIKSFKHLIFHKQILKNMYVEDVYVLRFLCWCCVHVSISKPVFLKGKSSLLSIGDGRVYWQVGDVPPSGGELWSRDAWCEDLIKNKDIFKKAKNLPKYSTSPQKVIQVTYVYQSLGCWMKEWLAPLVTGSFAVLFNRNSWSFCFTSVLATAPVRPKGRTKGIGVTLTCKCLDLHTRCIYI